MNNIKIALWALLAGLTLLWALADSFLPSPLTYFSLRSVMVQYTGIIAMAAMSVAIILAVRPRRVEPLLGGLDKMYRLHKWLGITAMMLASVHWFWGKGTTWAVGWGWSGVRPGLWGDRARARYPESLCGARRDTRRTRGADCGSPLDKYPAPPRRPNRRCRRGDAAIRESSACRRAACRRRNVAHP